MRAIKGFKIIYQKSRKIFNAPLLIGQVIEPPKNVSIHSDAERLIKVVQMQFHGGLNMYFNQSQNVLCTDREKTSKRGDLVLIQLNPDAIKQSERYQVKEIVHKIGDTVDPVTKIPTHFKTTFADLI